MVDHLLSKYVASESKHLPLKWGEAAPVRWPGSGGNHAAIAKVNDDAGGYWWMEETLCGIPVPQFNFDQYQAALRGDEGHLNPVCAGDVDCPACLEALGL